MHKALHEVAWNVSVSFILALHKPEALVMCHIHLQLPQEVAVTPIYVRSDRAAGWGRMRVRGIQHHLTWNENTNKPLFLPLAF